ncbi:hypothetical protein C0992_003685 [Termitomyces sp. T32_za158]|nr:hypothetical protein C0992_003685 [Termitomyces sp. T32_za158]
MGKDEHEPRTPKEGNLSQTTPETLRLGNEINQTINNTFNEFDFTESGSQESTSGNLSQTISGTLRLEKKVNEIVDDVFNEPAFTEPEFQESSPDIDLDVALEELGDHDELDLATACAHAQALLNAYNDSQNTKTVQEEDEPLLEAHIESLCIS